MSSREEFNRWESKEMTSWALRVFKRRNDELSAMYITFQNSHKYTYKNLGVNKATWNDLPSKHFSFDNAKEYVLFKNLKEWSTSYNELDNWINLNALVAISSNLETYMSTIIPLALESDIGIIYGAPKRIDGMEIKKHGKEKAFDFRSIITGCTKGTWESRIKEYERIFCKVPNCLKINISSLDKIRDIRNNVAHAFGRDIEESRRRGEVTTLRISRLSKKKFLDYQKICREVANEIDKHLLHKHIGEYQKLLYYHELFPELNHTIHPSYRAIAFRKKMGGHLGVTAGKIFSQGLVNYYESL